MSNLYSLFLSQAYKDCWDDYNRSLKLRNFPKWDYVILTASNELQAEGFRKQIEERKKFLPTKTRFVVISDRGGKRVGSGGATLEVLKYIHEQEESFDGTSCTGYSFWRRQQTCASVFCTRKAFFTGTS